MAINFAGYLFQDDGDVVSGATVQLLQVSDNAEEASTTTNSDGYWAFSEADQDRYYVKITAGTSVRYLRWADEISLKEIDVRNNEANTTPAATFTNLTNNAANQVAVFSGANTTRADDDEIYTSFKLANSAAELIEYGRMTVVAKDVTDGTEDGQIEFDVMKAGTLTKVWTITSSDAAAMSFDMNVDSLTIGSGADTDISLTFDANTADGVITWMEDEDYFQFSDEILMNSTEKILFGDTGTFIHQSSDGVLTITSDTTVDINGAVVFDGAITGATNITLSGELDAATLDISGNADIDGTLEADAITVDGTTLAEYIADTVGAMVTSNTESGITVAYQDGDNTLDFTVGTLNQDTTGTAAIATTVTITDNESTNEDNALIFTAGGDVDGGNLGLESDGTLTYNPSTGKVTATGFIGTLTGNVTGDVTGNVTGNTSGTAATVTTAAQTNITSLGTLTTLTVDNVIINGTTIGHTSDTDLMTVADGVLTVAGEVDATTLDISGNADIDGTTNLDAVDIDGDMRIDGLISVNKASASNVQLEMKASSTGAPNVRLYGTNDTLAWQIGTTNTDAGYIDFYDGGTLKAQIYPERTSYISNGDEGNYANLVLGHTDGLLPAGAKPQFQIIGETQNSASFGITRFSADANGPQIFITKSRHGTIGTYKFPEDGDSAGSIHWQSGDDTDDDLAIESGVIKVVHTADATQNASTTDMIFSVASAGGAAEKMRINSDSQVVFADGTASLPSITNSGDVNTGFFFPAADQVGLSIGGTQKLLAGVSSGRTLMWSQHGLNSHYYDPGSGYTGFAIVGLDDYQQGVFMRARDNNAAGPNIYLRIGRVATGVSNEGLGSIYFQSNDGETGAYIAASAAGTTWTTTSGEQYTNLTIQADSAGGASKGMINLSSNVGIKSTTPGNDAQAVLYIANGTAPSSSPANSVALYAEDVTSSSELKTRDEAGNVTTLSPHNFSLIGDKSEPMAWSYYSKNPFVGKEINIDMLKFIRAVEKLTGETYIVEKDLANSEKLDWDAEEQKKYDIAQAEITSYNSLDDDAKLGNEKPTAYTKVDKPSWLS